MIAVGIGTGALTDPATALGTLRLLAFVFGSIGFAMAVAAYATDAGVRWLPVSRVVIALMVALALASVGVLASDNGVVIYDVCKDVEGTWLWWLWACYLR